VLSRRAAEREIEAGHVKLNGQIAKIGDKVMPGVDKVVWNGRGVVFKKNVAKRVIALNKPRGYVCTASDEQGRKIVTELVEDAGGRLYPIGRLDMQSEGLLLMTNDGELTNKLTHPRHEIPKIYHVKIKGKVTEEQVKALSKPMDIDGYTILPVETHLISIKPDFCVLEMILYEGRNRQIRKMCQQVELKILRLCRVAIGNVKLGELAPGKWRYLNKTQISYLKGLKT
jgi:23S rRNA pseudouridine2605 synthase